MARKYVGGVGNEDRMDLETGRFSGYCMELPYDSTCYFQTGVLTTDATMIVGVAVYCGSYPAASAKIFEMRDGTTVGINVRWEASGEFSIYRTNTLIATTSGAAPGEETWFYLELKVVCGDSGSYELRINNTNVLSDASKDTKAGTHDYHDAVRFVGAGTLIGIAYDDIYICDGSGSKNNDFRGIQRVVAIRPNGDSAVAWTRSAGSTSYTLVDDGAADDDTTYVESSTSTQLDLYDYETLSGVTSITAIQINTTAKLTDASAFNIYQVAKSDDTQSDGSSVALASSYGTKTRILEDDPDTASAWSADGLNAAKFGTKLA